MISQKHLPINTNGWPSKLAATLVAFLLSSSCISSPAIPPAPPEIAEMGIPPSPFATLSMQNEGAFNASLDYVDIITNKKISCSMNSPQGCMLPGVPAGSMVVAWAGCINPPSCYGNVKMPSINWEATGEQNKRVIANQHINAIFNASGLCGSSAHISPIHKTPMDRQRCQNQASWE